MMKEDKSCDDKVIEVKIKTISLSSIRSHVWCVLEPLPIGKGSLCSAITELIINILEGKK